MCVVCQVYMKYYYYGSRVECGMQMIVCRSPTAESLSGLYEGLWPRILSRGSSYLLVSYPDPLWLLWYPGLL